MKITWHGHACFTMESSDGRIVFDPYYTDMVPGIKMPKLAADAVFCSHEHDDHNFRQAIDLSGKGFSGKFQRIHSFHDKNGGKNRGENLITVVETEGLRAAHLGDLGHLLDEKQLEEIGELDVLMTPVGGFYTIDAAEAAQVVRQLKPRIVIPMHYRGEGFGFDKISTVDEFLALSENVCILDTNEVELDGSSEAATICLSCPVNG